MQGEEMERAGKGEKPHQIHQTQRGQRDSTLGERVLSNQEISIAHVSFMDHLNENQRTYLSVQE
jgi:hypothetical protein